MSGIRSRNRPGNIAVPAWRCEDTTLDAYEFRVACWLASHVDHYLAEYVTRNEIARRSGVSQGKVSAVLTRLEELGIVSVDLVQVPQSQGGKRLIVTFDFDVWERRPDVEPRSPHDRAPGRQVTGARSPGDHISTTESEPTVANATAGDVAPVGIEAAKAIATWYWEGIRNRTGKPPVGIKFMALAKVIEPFLGHWTPGEIRPALRSVYDAGQTITRQNLERHLDGRARATGAGRRRATDDELADLSSRVGPDGFLV